MNKRYFWLLFLVFLFPMVHAQQNDCENAGLTCGFHSCPSHQEQVYQFSCSDDSSQGLVCCRDKVYANIAQKVIPTPKKVGLGKKISFIVQIPTFRDCRYFIANSKGVEMQEGAGGCGPLGKAFSFETGRLKELFGEVNLGIYKVKVIATKENNPDITLEETFEVAEESSEFAEEAIRIPGTYLIKKGDKIDINKIEAEVREISWALAGDTEPKVDIEGDNAQNLQLHEGEEGCLLYGAASNPISKNLLIKVEKIDKNEEEPEKSTAIITLTAVKEVFDPNKNGKPIEISKDVEETEQIETGEITIKKGYFCNGCELEKKCYPFGYRKGGDFCHDSKEFVGEKDSNEVCENNFECKSNLCISNQCVSENVFKKFLEWMKNLFGSE